MEYTTNNTSVPCKCGGRHQKTPAIINQHLNTKRHINWLFQRMSERLLDLTEKKDKVVLLKKMNQVILTGKVA